MTEKILKPYGSPQRQGDSIRRVFTADSKVVADKMIELHRWMGENTAGPAEAMMLLTNMLKVYQKEFGITAVITSENPPQ
jgi:hypothetical protein